MNDRSSPSAADLAKFFELVSEVVNVRRHVDLMTWLQGDVQLHLPHDILVAAWGDFHLGLIHFDVVSAMPGVRSENSAAESIAPLLGGMFDSWISGDRKPQVLQVGAQGFLWDGPPQDGSITDAMRGMRSALIHGICDQRGRHDCLYVFFSACPQRDHKEGVALKFLLPYIDCALRQVDLLPHQYPAGRSSNTWLPAKTKMEVCVDADTSLSDNEADIMKWVALGKTNAEISHILNVSSLTVKNHMQRIFRKLDVFSRAQAVSAFNDRAQPDNSSAAIAADASVMP